MKILWFTTSPSSADKLEQISNITGGWIKAEEHALKENYPDLNLSICFLSRKETKSYDINGTQYFPIKKTEPNRFLKFCGITGINKSSLFNQKREFLTVIKTVQPDIIHIMGTENTFSVIMDEVNVPVVISIQGIVTVCKHKYYSGISKQKTKNRFLRLYKRYGILSQLEKSAFSKARYIIGRTCWDKSVTSILAPQASYFHVDRLIRNGFYQSKWDKQRDAALIIITTLRSSVFKGIETIVQASALLSQIGIAHSWKIAGLESHDILVEIVQGMFTNSPNQVIYLGRLTEDELINQLLHSDIYVQSSHIENSPNGVAEALLLGMPVIATFAGGTPAYIENRKTGILIQDGDPWAMAGAIKELMDHFEFAAELGTNAREAALLRHDPKRICEALNNVYQDILRKQT